MCSSDLRSQGGGGGLPRWGAPRAALLPPGVGLPSFLVGVGEGRGEGKGGGRRPPLLVLFGLGRGGGAASPLPPLFLSTRAHVGPLSPRGVPVTSRYSGKIPISPGTLPISKYRLPIYQSSCLNHFETPRHVRNLIRDSEQTSVHQNS